MVMKTQALLEGLSLYKFDAAFGGARRDEEKSRAKERIFSFRDKFHQWDPKNQRPELVGHLQCPSSQRRIHPCFSNLKLDRTRHLAIHPSGKNPNCTALLCQGTPSCEPGW